MSDHIFITNKPEALCMSVGGGIRILASFPVDGKELGVRADQEDVHICYFEGRRPEFLRLRPGETVYPRAGDEIQARDPITGEILYRRIVPQKYH